MWHSNLDIVMDALSKLIISLIVLSRRWNCGLESMDIMAEEESHGSSFESFIDFC